MNYKYNYPKRLWKFQIQVGNLLDNFIFQPKRHYKNRVLNFQIDLFIFHRNSWLPIGNVHV